MNSSHEIFKHKHIILAVDHNNSLAMIRSLGEEGIKPIVLLTAENPYLVPKSKYIGELKVFKTFMDTYKYLIDTYSNEPLKPFVYHGNDNLTVLLDSRYKEMEGKFYFMNGQGNMTRYLNKFEITKLAEECGLGIPKEELLNVGDLPTTLRYPVFTKAVTSATGGSWKDQAFICQNVDELKEAYSHIKAEKILVQEYIEKKNELCIDGISLNRGEQVFMPYSCGYYRSQPGKYGNYMKFVPFRDAELTEKIRKVIEGSKYTGIFCIEFMVGQNDELYFLEVNFRHSGWGYAFTYGGYNLPVRWAISTLENKISKDGFNYLESFDAVDEFPDFRDIRALGIPFMTWWKQMRSVDCFYTYNKKDPAPFWAEIRRMIIRNIKKII